MSKPVLVLMNWNHMPPTQMASLAHGVADAISKNAATFTSPVVLPNDLDAAATALELAYANRLNGPVAKQLFKMRMKPWIRCCTKKLRT